MFASRRAVLVAREQLPRHAPRAQRLARLYSTQDVDAAAAATPAADSIGNGNSTPGDKAETAAASSTTTTPPRGRYVRSARANPFTKARAGAAPASSSSTAEPGSHPPANNVPAKVIYSPKTSKYPAPARPPPGPSGKYPATAATTPPDVDWANTFYGISSQPVDPEQFKLLAEPLRIEDIEVKPDGVIYLPEIKYRRKLNEVFGPMGWGMIPKGEAVVGDNIVTREYALIINNRFVAQAQGENQYFSPEQLPSAVEGCKSNALMRCCKDIGVGSELWDPSFIRWFKKANMEEVWVEHSVTKKKRTLWYKRGEVDVQYPYKQTK